MSPVLQSLQRLLDRALASSNASAREVCNLREALRVQTAAADRWREALERIAKIVDPPAAADAPLSALPEHLLRAVHATNGKTRKLQSELSELGLRYTAETRDKRAAQSERNALREVLPHLIAAAEATPGSEAPNASDWIDRARALLKGARWPLKNALG